MFNSFKSFVWLFNSPFYYIPINTKVYTRLAASYYLLPVIELKNLFPTRDIDIQSWS